MKSDTGKTDDAEDKSMKQAQKNLYSMMMANREAGTEVKRPYFVEAMRRRQMIADACRHVKSKNARTRSI